MNVVIEGNGTIVAPLKPDTRTSRLLLELEGRRNWRKDGFAFEGTAHNRATFVRLFPEAVLPGAGQPASSGPTQAAVGRSPRPLGEARTKPFKHQVRALVAAMQQPYFALFLEQGTGKTKVAIDRFTSLWADGKIDAVLVVTKKGVHTQWVESELPRHVPTGVRYDAEAWDGKKMSALMTTGAHDRLKVFTINCDALIAGKQGMSDGTDSRFKETRNAAVQRFVKAHEGRLMMIVDESQIIKNYRAQRTRACYELAQFANYRLILTGTPIAKDLTDEWSQFKFLDESIIGYRYITAFRNNFCVMGGFQGRSVVGAKNLDEFKRRVGPYSFRVTKEEELDLPPKQFAQETFTMHPDQRKHFDALRKSFVTAIDNGELASVKNAATLMMRLQQITCGALPLDDGSIQELPNPRLQALMEVLEQRQGKVVIWARFNHDIKQISAALKGKCVTYFGETSTNERDANVKRFLAPNSGIDYFISNPAAGGTGLNLQGDCRTVVFYSNSFNAIDRWQAEDRVHRIGTIHTVTYIDLICAGSPDRKILANLRGKKSLSDLALGDIKELVM